MNDDLRATLTRLLESRTRSNPALNRLLDDYTKYHVVLAVIATLFALALATFALVCFSRYRRARRAPRRSTFRTRTYLGFGALSALTALGLAVITAGNVSNVKQPRVGLAGALGILGSPAAGTRRALLQESFNAWLQSRSARLPATVREHVVHRLAWQRPKAIICSILLGLAVTASVVIWKRLLAQSGSADAGRRVRRMALLASGVGTVAAIFVLMLMVMGNTQASLAPLSMTLFYG